MTDKTYTFDYYNPDSPDIIRLEAQTYALKIKGFKLIDQDTAHVTVSGNSKNIKRFKEDVEEDVLEWSESKRDLDDDEYHDLVKTELAKFGIKTA